MLVTVLLAGVWLDAAGRANAALFNATYNSGFANSGNIPDGNPNPWSDTRTVSGITDLSIQSVSIRLDLAGGYNGDLHGYLSYNGNKVVLLNRVGVGTRGDPVFTFGFSGAGFRSLVLQDGAGDIHFYGGGVTTGIYSADGRDVSPLASPATLLGTSRVTFAEAFGGMNPNGEWSLVFADVSIGGGQSQVTSWGLDISAVPEPVNVALGVFALGAVILHRVRAWRVRRNGRPTMETVG